MIKPIPTSKVKEKGIYIHFLGYNNKSTLFNDVSCGAFYEFDPEDDYKWRTDSGCGDCGPFDDTDFWIGPIIVTQHRNEGGGLSRLEKIFDEQEDYTWAKITDSKHLQIGWGRRKVGFGNVLIGIREDGDMMMLNSQHMDREFVLELFEHLIKNAAWDC